MLKSVVDVIHTVNHNIHYVTWFCVTLYNIVTHNVNPRATQLNGVNFISSS